MDMPSDRQQFSVDKKAYMDKLYKINNAQSPIKLDSDSSQSELDEGDEQSSVNEVGDINMLHQLILSPTNSPQKKPPAPKKTDL